MYIAALLNSEGVFRRVESWRKAVAETKHAVFDAFLHRATTATVSLKRMDALAAAAVAEYAARKDGLTLRTERIVFWSPTTVQFIGELPTFFATLRAVQNEVLGMVGLHVRSSLPSSFSDYVKTPRKYGLPEAVRERLVAYWVGAGERLKHYRDLDQHFAVVTHHTYLRVVKPERLLVFLPDNPEEKSLVRLTFNQEIEALPYCHLALREIDSLVDGLATVFNFAEAPLGQAFRMGDQGVVVPGVRRTMGLLIQEDQTFSGLEIGHAEDQRVYVTRF